MSAADPWEIGPLLPGSTAPPPPRASAPPSPVGGVSADVPSRGVGRPADVGPSGQAASPMPPARRVPPSAPQLPSRPSNRSGAPPLPSPVVPSPDVDASRSAAPDPDRRGAWLDDWPDDWPEAEAGDETDDGSSARRRRVLVLAVAACLAVASAAAGGVLVWRSLVEAGPSDAPDVAAACDAARKGAVRARAGLLSYAGGDEVRDALAVAMEDPSLAGGLASAVAAAGTIGPAPSSGVCLAGDVERTRVGLDAQARAYEAALSSLRAEAGRVSAAHAAKVRDRLDATVGGARRLLDSSKGRVSDEATRKSLSDAIDMADDGRDGDDAAALDSLETTLKGAMARVEESMAEKGRADKAKSGGGSDRPRSDAAPATPSTPAAPSAPSVPSVPSAPSNPGGSADRSGSDADANEGWTVPESPSDGEAGLPGSDPSL